MKESTYTFSKTKEEWYQQENICNKCGCHFMVDFEEEDGLFCPRCGTKLFWDGIDKHDEDF